MNHLQCLPVGPIGTNVYLRYLPEEKLMLIVDPGAEAERIAERAKKSGAERYIVLLTHAHIDHIAGLPELSLALPLECVFLREPDHGMYWSRENAIPPMFPAAEGLPPVVSDVTVPGMEILSVPGHTPGGSAFYFPAEGELFAGDTLFDHSVGRTDLPGGSWQTLLRSIREELWRLPDETCVYCGHGPATTIGIEKRENPYVR